MRLALVTNVASGRRDRAGRGAEPLRGAGAAGAVPPLEPGARDATQRAAAEAAAERPDRLAVAGGDGSIGPVAACACAAGLPLAALPTRTANDLPRALRL